MQNSRYEDGLDSEEKKLIGKLSTPWQRTFLLRFYGLLEKYKLRKKDIPLLLEDNPDKYKWLSSDYFLTNSTLTECTKFDSDNLHLPKVDTLIAICLALGVTADYLLGFDTIKIPENQYDSKRARIANEIVEYILENKKIIQDEYIRQKVKELERLKKDVSGDNVSEHPFFMS